jgi:hypothetical protein
MKSVRSAMPLAYQTPVSPPDTRGRHPERMRGLHYGRWAHLTLWNLSPQVLARLMRIPSHNLGVGHLRTISAWLFAMVLTCVGAWAASTGTLYQFNGNVTGNGPGNYYPAMRVMYATLRQPCQSSTAFDSASRSASFKAAASSAPMKSWARQIRFSLFKT